MDSQGDTGTESKVYICIRASSTEVNRRRQHRTSTFRKEKSRCRTPCPTSTQTFNPLYCIKRQIRTFIHIFLYVFSYFPNQVPFSGFGDGPNRVFPSALPSSQNRRAAWWSNQMASPRTFLQSPTVDPMHIALLMVDSLRRLH